MIAVVVVTVVTAVPAVSGSAAVSVAARARVWRPFGVAGAAAAVALLSRDKRHVTGKRHVIAKFGLAVWLSTQIQTSGFGHGRSRTVTESHGQSESHYPGQPGRAGIKTRNRRSYVGSIFLGSRKKCNHARTAANNNRRLRTRPCMADALKYKTFDTNDPRSHM